jgi:dipeptidyl aminopeptidase/acylaminoacyl peptidase
MLVQAEFVTSFRDLPDYVAIPRVTALRLSPDGSWLAAAVQTLGPEPTKYVTSIWRIATDPGGRPARLTRSAEGEGGPEFLPDGSVLFVSRRPGGAVSPGNVGGPGDTDSGQDKPGPGKPAPDKPALWLLSAGGGEARRVATPPGGVSSLAVARGAEASATAVAQPVAATAGEAAGPGLGAVVFASPVLRGSGGAEADRRRRKARKDAGVTAILHESNPVRYWDHDLGPDSLRLQVGAFPPLEERADADRAGGAAGSGSGDGWDADEAGMEVRELTPDAGRALDENSFELTPDGTRVVTGWATWDAAGNRIGEVHVIDVATGERRTLLAAPDCDFEAPHVSPDGRMVVCRRAGHDTYEAPGDITLVLAALDGEGSAPRDLLPGLDRRPGEVAWAPDSGAVYFTADDHGRRPVFRVEVASGQVARLTADHGAYDNLCPAPDGRLLYALRSAVDEPPTPVRLDVAGLTDAAGGADRGLERLAAPGLPVRLPGRLEEIETTTADGATIRAWLVLPEQAPGGTGQAAPAPLLLWVHGGPVMSWNAWSWRWNPWLMAARGYAVLLPDPALSTGYGQDFIARGHGQWGGAPYDDLMAITDAAAARPDIDQERTAMMGGSYGGYMANWMAGHTDRFRAIVSHAGLWFLDQMFGTTDMPAYWRRMFGDPATQPERYLTNSPHLNLDQIRTPMLVIHGDKDYRVPVSEALRLWWDLQGRLPGAKFLYFPDENHWILGPGHVQVWYETVLAFLAEHVLGEPWRRPELL